MKQIEQERLTTINGGAAKLGIGLAIAAGVVFLIGVIDGFFRPLRCN